MPGMKPTERKPDPSLRALIRRAIERDGRTLPAIAVAAEVDRTQLWRYLKGKRDIGSASADRLIAALGLQCRLSRRKGKS